MTRRILKVAASFVFAITGIYCIELAVPKHDYYLERTGSLDAHEREVTVSPTTIHERLRLVSSSGLGVDMRVLRPARPPGEKLPLVLLLGGQRTGRDAVDFVGAPTDIAYAAIDYPYLGPEKLGGFWPSVGAVPDIQQAFLDTPAALLLALRWALRQPWVDKDRIELVGISLGVPFAAIAGALDTRFTRVWFMHGGGHNPSWAAGAARGKIENDFLRRLAAHAGLFLVYGNSIDTPRWMSRIAPRPLIIVSSCADEYVTREALAPFIEASASEHVELYWTRGAHVRPGRRDVLDQLFGLIAERVRGEASAPAMRCPGELAL